MNLAVSERPRVAMLQWGARLHYATPAALARGGLLQVLYVDWSIGFQKSRFEQCLSRLGGSRGALARAMGRSIPASIDKRLIKSFPYFNIQQLLMNRISPASGNSSRVASSRAVGSHGLASKLAQNQFCGANSFYTHACAATKALKAAREMGLFTIVEAISEPFNKLTEIEEQRRFGIETDAETESRHRDNVSIFFEETTVADLVIAASPFVCNGLSTLGVHREKISVVPYGIDLSAAAVSHPVPGRVLFVGKVCHLKGVHYLALAHRLLTGRMGCGSIETRVVGPYESRLIKREEFLGPNYVGQIPRPAVVREFSSADVFVFPTLSDGFGMVLLEALRAGVPVVTTRNCADVVKDGYNGFVVPERDGDAIAERVGRLVRDRDLRGFMSSNAKKTAEALSLDAYAANLCRIVTQGYVGHAGKGGLARVAHRD